MIKQYLPDNCYSSKEIEIDGAVIHFISARYTNEKNPFDRDSIVDILKKYKLSYNYLIERDGTVVKLVPGNHKTYHAGKSIMNGRGNCNDFTVGIALVGGSIWPYTDEQMLSLGQLLAQLMTEHQFSSDWIRGHDEVRDSWNIVHPYEKADVKHDPGEHFRWEILNDMIASVSMTVKNRVKNV